MKRIYFILFLIIIIALVFFFLSKGYQQKDNFNVPQINQPKVLDVNQEEENLSNIKTLNNLQPPLDKAGERVNKKEFGVYTTPQNSPIQPERFKGFHTGVDFEVFSEELNTEVSVYAICPGKIKLKQYVSGYGGIAVQVCELNKEPITIIYGHLKLSSITVNIDENIETGEIIGILGADKSQETDYERKHLHLGIHKGIEINVKGYVNSQPELLNWTDPCFYICHN